MADPPIELSDEAFNRSFDLPLTGEDISFQELVEFTKEVLPGSHFDNIIVRFAPGTQGIRLEPRRVQ